jgi:broad specificity phosphatase PhoE
MRVVLVRHAQVAFSWQGKYSSATFDADCAKYDQADIVKIPESKQSLEDQRVYISGLKRSKDTAVKLFCHCRFLETSLIDEVGMKSFMDTHAVLPAFVWFALGRF